MSSNLFINLTQTTSYSMENLALNTVHIAWPSISLQWPADDERRMGLWLQRHTTH